MYATKLNLGVSSIKSLIEVKKFVEILREDGDLPPEGLTFGAALTAAYANEIRLNKTAEVLLGCTNTDSISIQILGCDELINEGMPIYFDSETNWMMFYQDALVIHTAASVSPDVLIWIRKNLLE
jgi:hypothetical protein